MEMEAIWVTYSEQICFNKEAMESMKRLRILRIRDYSSIDSDDIPNGSIEFLSNNLRWVEWELYPWVSLPENLNPKVLFILISRGVGCMIYGQKERLNLRNSKRLMRTPDFRGMPNLEYLDLYGCVSVEEVHPSLGYCKKLIRLFLYGCKNLKRFPSVSGESLEHLDLRQCSSLEKFPEILGRMKAKLEIKVKAIGIKELPTSIFQPQAHLTKLELSFMKNLLALPSSIGMLKGLVKLDVSCCLKLESLPEEIGDLENLEELHASWTLISRPPSSIARLNKLKFLNFSSQISGLYFVFPPVNEGFRSLEILDLHFCNLIDGGLPEDIGCLSSLKKLNLRGNDFEHLPRSVGQLGALQSLDLRYCQRLREFPGFMGMSNLEILHLTWCNLIDGGLPEDIGSLSSLKKLDLTGNNFEHLPRNIAQLGALRCLDLSDCKRLTQLPEFPEQLDEIYADWGKDWICNSLFRNISSLQHDNTTFDSLSLRVFTSLFELREDIPSWFHLRGTDKSVSVNLPENWYLRDNFLGFAICYYGIFIDITIHLIPLYDDGMSSMTQTFALYSHSKYSHIHFFLVPFAGLWNTSKANGKTPNDYRHIMLSFSKETKYGFRLFYKDEPAVEAFLQMRGK